MLSAILRLLSHFYGPLYACNNLKLVYLCTLEALEIKKLFDCEEKYGKDQSFQSCLLLGFSRPAHPPTLLYAISIQKNIDNSGRPLIYPALSNTVVLYILLGNMQTMNLQSMPQLP